MTQFLPPNLLALFAPRDPPPYLPPADKLTHEKKRTPYIGIAQYTHLFEDPKDTPPPTRAETRDERRERKRREKAEQVAYKLEQEIATWDPHSSGVSTMDPFKTLFIARINFDTSESKLRREFEVYGVVRKIVLVHDKRTSKPRGYAFIEYEHERDMHSAYKHADGKKIDGRRVLVDVERARTVKGWLPRRLGGGLGGTRRGGPDVNVKHSGREDNERERQRYLDRERERERGVPERAERDRGQERERDRERDRDRGTDREKERDRDRRRRSRSRERKRTRRSEDRGDVSVSASENNGPATSGDERRKDKDKERDKERRRSRSRDHERRKRSRSRDRKRLRRNDGHIDGSLGGSENAAQVASGDERRREKDRVKDKSKEHRERRDRYKDKERERRDYVREDGEQVRVKEEPIDDYDYTAQQYEGYGQYDPDNIKYEVEESQFQTEEY
ncbi:U1 small nuclear ribonucleoprotein 70 kDa-like [Daphnia carinata]|uniref:U1 small nuclear ribonucleoprotein 70 kDa-like n=1 Tax=Daphnia carinata TaxID=120202 RepID=UPI00257FB2D0|nr:U1 small nuclear ribonucleoprotein 70 kDa-like [Daphnia carinata]